MTLLLLLALACGPGSPEAESCAGLAPDSCDDWANCVTIEAYADASSSPEAVGCAYAEDPEEYACPAAEICIHDPAQADSCWRSSSGCIPDGWSMGCADGEDSCFEE